MNTATQLLELIGNIFLWIGVLIAFALLCLVIYMVVGIPIYALRNAIRKHRGTKDRTLDRLERDAADVAHTKPTPPPVPARPLDTPTRKRP